MTARVHEAVLEPHVHITAMAAIVRDLLAGGRDRLQDVPWLHSCIRAAGLDRHESAALEALRARLCAQGATELVVDPLRLWF